MNDYSELDVAVANHYVLGALLNYLDGPLPDMRRVLTKALSAAFEGLSDDEPTHEQAKRSLRIAIDHVKSGDETQKLTLVPKE
ncbi:hypothetical protein [Caballeronia sp. LZ032]|uniref:hypothetical protein n=1 Tax=Caballeronia sp. LZ032 TaxID=3038565 RepID=UPI002865B73F|nr:hypothetical protein [Caballeronia sp. LZ032]MDR5881093.1 hypothetical protein [Caballeronia sp. LZ032]